MIQTLTNRFTAVLLASVITLVAWTATLATPGSSAAPAAITVLVTA